MARCPSCEYPLPYDRERLGARCPSCRDPLYEPPGRAGRPARDGEGACPVHAGVETVGTCARCGNYLCEVCRTRWRGQVWCAACVDRALGGGDAPPEQARGHLRQALLSLGLGAAAWVLLLAGFLLAGVAVAVGGGGAVVLALLAVVAWGAEVLLGAFGVGAALAALRTRGSHMILATVGLIVSGLSVGVFIGVITMGVWQS